MGLYNSVGWSSYTRDPARLAAAVRASLAVVTARQDGTLIGLARLVGDGLTIAYLQDILIAPDYRRHGIGRELFQRAFAPFGDVRQKVLITDDEPSQRAFYESMGFAETSELDHPIRTFVQFGERGRFDSLCPVSDRRPVTR
ncbi:GNAT superfamily N-acetyltransferase [Pseudoclavibacter chungangensis]|uniref:GNAT family N-acetyltransferase n=1 Tax=Pseudoclavibacter chungangensis TaxID=587635 RepID=UPI0018582064|nr:GNAT family N-acetyltransferase [Pseudoclavibacter chungangensis]NYJ65994.1 GNAT superfamily N-acetyltransferase [Pseudoclavibacter chungangensis]